MPYNPLQIRQGPDYFCQIQGRIFDLPVDGPSVLIALSASPGEIRYSNVNPRLQGADQYYYKSTKGYAVLHEAGVWYARSELTGSTAVVECYKLLRIDPSMLWSQLYIEGLVGACIDVCRIGGAAQTGLDLTAQFSPYTMAAPTFATVGVASGSVLGASASRRFLSLENTHASQHVYLGFGSPAVVGSGVVVRAGAFKSFATPTGHVQSEVFAIADGAGTNLAIQSGS